MVHLEYLRDSRFRVQRNFNSSLQEGDEFEGSSFFLGYPLYIPRILRKGEYTPSFHPCGLKSQPVLYHIFRIEK